MADGSCAPIIVADVVPDPGILVSWFAGGGLQSEVIREVFKRSPDAALNHWPTAVYTHMAQHPDTEHFLSDVEEIAPRSVQPGRPVAFGWFSPDCTDFSRAKGKAPRSERRRGLCWQVTRWGAERRPSVIIMENVVEFLDSGPLDDSGERIKGLEGVIFAAWCGEWDALGYTYEYRELNSADYGALTARKRLIIILRCDGLPITWPEKTHAPRKLAEAKGLLPYRGAWEALDFTLPCPSIFLEQAEAKAAGLNVKRPLAANTMKRVAKGIDRFVVGSAEPFLVSLTHQGAARVRSMADLLPTVTAARRGEMAIVSPTMVGLAHGDGWKRGGARGRPMTEPTHTIKAGGGDHAIVAPSLMQIANWSRDGVRSADDSMRALTAYPKGGSEALISACLAPSYGERPGQPPRALSVEPPYPTAVPGGNGGKLVTVHLGRQFGASVGSPAGEPAGVITAGGGGKTQVVATSLSTYYRTGEGSDCNDPARTGTTSERHAMLAAFLEQAATGLVGHPPTNPMSTIVGKGCTQRMVEARLELEGGDTGRRANVLAFLWSQFGEPTAEEWADPLATHAGRLKFGLVCVPDGVAVEDGGGFAVWMIVDIGLRMLIPRELLAAMGWAGRIDLSVDAFGRAVSKTDQTHMIGNGIERNVCVAVASANMPAGFA